MWNNVLRESSHLLRLFVVLAGAVGLFLIVRASVVPEGFGKYGHYRAGALDDNRNHPLVHAGQAQCVLCHEDQANARKQGKHAGVACEACHGPLALHAEDPDKNKPAKPAATALCISCHEKDAAKPKWFKQVASKEHSQGMDCNACHQPHKPKL